MKNEKGSLTFEATLTLVIFISLLMFITLFSKVCITYSQIDICLNRVAKEIGNYSYLYAVSGLYEKDKDLQDKINNESKIITDTSESFISILSTINQDKSQVSREDIITEVKEIGSNINTVYDNISYLVKNPKKLVVALFYLGLNEGYKDLKGKIITGISKTLFINRIESLQNSNIMFCKISEEDFDFSTSKALDNNDLITLNLKYPIRFTLPFYNEFKIDCSHQAKIRAWMFGDKKRDRVTDDSNEANTHSVWYENTFLRGKNIIKNESQNYKLKGKPDSGVHAIEIKDDELIIYRFLSFDSNCKSNNISQFKREISSHYTTLLNKLDNGQLECINSKNELVYINLLDYKVRTSITTIVPENTDLKEYKDYKSHLADLVTEKANFLIKRGYGNSAK